MTKTHSDSTKTPTINNKIMNSLIFKDILLQQAISKRRYSSDIQKFNIQDIQKISTSIFNIQDIQKIST